METQLQVLQETRLQESQTLNLKMPNGSGGFSLVEVSNNQLAHSSKDFFMAFSHMMLTTRKSGAWNTEYESGLFQQVLKMNEVTCKELYDSFFKAYSDQYTPSSGIEWRNLWKHIEEARMGKDRTYYTYDEMLSICHKDYISTDHFEFIEKDKWKRK